MEYEQQFERYDRARTLYQQLQDDMRNFLARFPSQRQETEQMSIRDLAYLEGLRVERDIAFADFYKAEAEVFKSLIARLLQDH